MHSCTQWLLAVGGHEQPGHSRDARMIFSYAGPKQLHQVSVRRYTKTWACVIISEHANKYYRGYTCA